MPQTARSTNKKPKTPLIAGTALVGAAAGVVVKDRLEKSRSKRRGIRVPKPGGERNLANLDLEQVTLEQVTLEKVRSAADRVSAYGRQTSDIASVAKKTRNKNN